MFLIKDGEIIREFESLSLGDNFVNNVVFSFGELYVNCTDRLMGIDLQTGEMQLLTDDNGYITAINKGYIILSIMASQKYGYAKQARLFTRTLVGVELDVISGLSATG